VSLLYCATLNADCAANETAASGADARPINMYRRNFFLIDDLL